MIDKKCKIHTIKIRKPKVAIPYYTENITLPEAIQKLQYIREHKCIDCDEKCIDCYLDYEDKIALEKILEFLYKKRPIIKTYKKERMIYYG